MKLAVLAIGGNAFTNENGNDSYDDQLSRTKKMCTELVKLVKQGYRIIVTHGNGPQIGNLLIQQESAPELVPPMPIEVCDAMTQGQIGYMIVQTLRNHLKKNNIDKHVAAILTQVVVDQRDEAFRNPTKFIGPFFNKKTADLLINERKWEMKKDSNRGFRRVVPSPKPVDIVEKKEITEMIKKDFIVVAGGGGGIPVIRKKNGELKGVGAVIDKDLVSQKLATLTKAKTLIIVTPVDQVALHFGTPRQKNIKKMTVDEAKRYLEEGHFPPGSMGPKMQAAIKFLEEGGDRVLITSVKSTIRALERKSGTEIVHGIN
ncbi:MAG: carbamate kinase [Thermodesulfobacteriota bacterium]